MRAVAMSKGELNVIELPDPEPGPGEVLVRTVACGICGSDLHALKHTHSFIEASLEVGTGFGLYSHDPVVMGHEFCAEVVDYGPRTEGSLSPGALVCSVPVLRREPPQSIGYSPVVPGGFAEYMLLSESLMAPVPVGLGGEHAALTEPMAVGLHGVNMARLNGDEAALVIGCGPVGLAVITSLKLKGIGPIVAADYSPKRRALAETMGADVVLDPAEEKPYGHSTLAGRETVYFECVGVRGMINELFRESPRNGRLVIVGVCLEEDHSKPLFAINKELNVQYVLGYTVEEFVDTLHHIADGRIDVTPIITGETGLDGVADMFTELGNPEAQAKVLVKPSLA